MIQPLTRKCCDCKEEKPLDEFTKNKGSSKSRSRRCKDCEKERLNSLKPSAAYKAKYFVHDEKWYL